MSGLLLILFLLGSGSVMLSVIPIFKSASSIEAQTTFFSLALLAFACLGALFFNGQELVTVSIPWFALGQLNIQLGLAIDSVSLTMGMLITTITAIVHIYSWGYLENDPQRPRFFGLISFFSVMILLLVFSSNLLPLFIGWEGVGVASFLLIGFWRENHRARHASIQAFLANRLGDWAFLIGLFVLASNYHTWDWPFIIYQQDHFTEVGLVLLAFGAITKSAQLPMSFWLPGSMEGPTPISALIHAATMVTAGVYLLIRFEPLIAQSLVVQHGLLGMGCLTIIIMSTKACLHTDIKRIIAYSTMAQLGYMVVGVALLEPDLSLCHLWTHGFFKALLFLSAGCAIVVRDHKQSLEALSGILRSQRLLLGCFIIGLLSLIAVPGLPGFYSKELLIATSKKSYWVVSYSLQIGAFLTAAYSGRILGYLWLCPVPVNIKKDKKIPGSMIVSTVLLAIATLAIVPISLTSSPFFIFPWSTTLSQQLWWHIAYEPLVGLIALSFIASVMATFYRRRTPQIGTSNKNTIEAFDTITVTLTNFLYQFIEKARPLAETLFEKGVESVFFTPIVQVASGVQSLQKKSLRHQVLIFFVVIAVITVLLEGGKTL